MAIEVATDMADCVIGCVQLGSRWKNSDSRTPTAQSTGTPTRNVPRRVSGRLSATCMPPTNMNVPLKNSAPAITGFGIWTMSDASFGRQASTTSHSTIDHATHQLADAGCLLDADEAGTGAQPRRGEQPSDRTADAVRRHAAGDRLHVGPRPCGVVDLLAGRECARGPQSGCDGRYDEGQDETGVNVTPSGKVSGSAKTALSCNPSKKWGFTCPKHAATR